MKVIMRVLLTLVLMLFQALGSVQMLQSVEEFQQAISTHPSTLVYFFTTGECEFCGQFNHSYALLGLMMDTRKDLHMAKIGYEGNEELFSKEHVEGAPEVRYYRNGAQHQARFTHLEYDHSCLDELAEWVDRLTGALQRKAEELQKHHSGGLMTWIQPKQENQNQLKLSKNVKRNKKDRIVFNCDRNNAVEAFQHSQVYYDLLQIDFECGESGRIVFKTKPSLNSDNNNHHLQTCETSISSGANLSQNCISQIYNIRNRGVQVYGHEHIHHLFHQPQNQGMFVLITNNDTDSIKYLNIYSKIKNHWDFSAIVHQKYPYNSRNPHKTQNDELFVPIFAVADVAMQMSSPFMRDTIESAVHRLKRFIGGYEYVGWPYPYPILAYLKTFPGHDGSNSEEQELVKYLFRTKTLTKMIDEHLLEENRHRGQENITQLTKQIESWMKKVITAPKSESYRRSQKELSIGDAQGDQPENIDDEIDSAKKGAVIKVYRHELQNIVASLQKSSNHQSIPICYIMVYWRNHEEMQRIKSEFDAWWHAHAEKYDTPYFLLDLFENDLPDDIHLTHLPAVLEYYGDQTVKTYQVNDKQDIQKIIESSYSRHHSTSENEEK